MRLIDVGALALATMVVAYSTLMLRCCWLSRRIQFAIASPFQGLSRDPDWVRAQQIWRHLNETTLAQQGAEQEAMDACPLGGARRRED